MTLSLAGRSPAKFEWAAGDMSACFTIPAEASQEQIISTFERVVAFVRSQEGEPSFTDSLMAGTRDLSVPEPPPPAKPANGWADLVAALPEDAELIDAEEE